MVPLRCPGAPKRAHLGSATRRVPLSVPTVQTTQTAPTPAPVLDDERNRNAYNNGRSQVGTLVALYEAHQFCQEELEGADLCREAKAVLREHGYPNDSRVTVAESIEESAREEALSVEVRSAWQLPSGDGLEAAEWRIVLTTGGPELVLSGHLDRYNEPAAPELRCRDWFTQYETVRTTSDEDAALSWFACLFYFGD